MSRDGSFRVSMVKWHVTPPPPPLNPVLVASIHPSFLPSFRMRAMQAWNHRHRAPVPAKSRPITRRNVSNNRCKISITNWQTSCSRLGTDQLFVSPSSWAPFVPSERLSKYLIGNIPVSKQKDWFPSGDKSGLSCVVYCVCFSFNLMR